MLERGVDLVVSYLDHQMAKEIRPEDQIARWISGALAQVADPHLISLSRAVAGQLPVTGADAHDDIMAPMRALLIEPVTALGGDDPDRDADAVFQLTTATMRRYVGATTRPDSDDIAHLVRFCLSGLGTS